MEIEKFIVVDKKEIIMMKAVMVVLERVESSRCGRAGRDGNGSAGCGSSGGSYLW